MAENIIAAHPINMHYLTNSEIMLSCEGEQIKDQVKYLEDQINILKIRLDALSNQVATNTADIDLLQKEELGPDASITPVNPKQKSDLEIFNQNLQEVFSNVGISAQEAYTALGELADWIKEDKKWY